MIPNADIMKNTDANIPTCIPEQSPRIARYLSALADGTFDASIAYTEQEVGRGDRILRGAYYGFSYDGEYKRGYFRIDTRSGESSILRPFEVECGDEAELFDDAFWACRSFWKPSLDSALPELSSIGTEVLQGGEVYEDDDHDHLLIFSDHWFDCRALSDLSSDWGIAVYF
ncbi:MAG: hypothetical protein LC687_04260 [Actinobacteria bacterium]|nr:hypothetical protein [Actinomycetota bacterium]